MTTTQIPHPRIGVRRKSIQAAEDGALNAELMRRGWRLPAWFQFQSDKPEAAGDMAWKIYAQNRTGRALRLDAFPP
jgi:hypothetical protein